MDSVDLSRALEVIQKMANGADQRHPVEYPGFNWLCKRSSQIYCPVICFAKKLRRCNQPRVMAGEKWRKEKNSGWIGIVSKVHLRELKKLRDSSTIGNLYI